jgi:hypothetical protein
MLPVSSLLIFPSQEHWVWPWRFGLHSPRYRNMGSVLKGRKGIVLYSISLFAD